jgi:spore coat protein U-like protein
MKHLVLTALMAASLTALCGSVNAATPTVGQTFTVSASLTSKCLSTTSGTPDINFGTYTAFVGPATTAPTATVTFKCSKGVTVTPSLDSSTNSILGLTYTLALGSDTTGTASGADTHSFVVTGTMATGQPGDLGGNASGIVHTLTLAY